MGELSLRDIFPKDGKFTFLVGAGVSRDAPSNLPLGRQMMEAIVEHSCAESEVNKILELENLRFEQLVEIVRYRLDHDLKIIDYYGLCDRPNSIHFFIVEMMKRGNFVLTTNFDYLIEYALVQSNVKKKYIIPVITQNNFKIYSDVLTIIQKGYFPVYKIHGSPRNIITGISTKDSLVATIQAFGSGKGGESVFQLEPFKRPLFDNISNGRTLVVLGYSGSDDFDIVPTLKQLPNLTQIIWVDHTPKGSEPIVQELQDIFDISSKDKVGLILHEIQQMKYKTRLFRVKMHTSEIVDLLIKRKKRVSKSPFSEDPIIYMKNEIDTPDFYLKFQIPFEIYNVLSLVEDAERCARVILEYSRKEKNQQWESIALNNIASIFDNKGKLDEALSYYRDSLAIVEQLGDLQGKAIRLSNIGQLLYRKGELNEAILCYKESLAINEKLGNLRGKVTDLSNIGAFFHEKGELEEAIRYYKEVLTINEQLGDLWSRASHLNNIGLLFYGKGDLNEAFRYYKEALAIDEQLGNLQGKATDFNNIGSLFYNTGELDKAVNYFTEALAINERLGDLAGKATDLHNIGLVFKDKGELDNALRYFTEALTIDEQLSNLRGKATDLNNIGLLLYGKGELDNAFRHYKEALAIDEQLGNLHGKATRFNNIGLLLCRKGELEEALQYYEKALTIAEELGDLPGKATNLSNIGSFLYEIGKLDEALHYYKEALAIDEQIGDLRNKVNDLNIIGSLLYKQEKYEQALPYFEECAQIGTLLRMNSNIIEETKKWMELIKNKLKSN